jgi:hypothetical protein
MERWRVQIVATWRWRFPCTKPITDSMKRLLFTAAWINPVLFLERGRAKCRTSFCQPSKPARCCCARDHARITRQRRMRDVEKSIRSSGVGRARSQQKSRARFVDSIVFCNVVDAAGRRPRSRASSTISRDSMVGGRSPVRQISY